MCAVYSYMLLAVFVFRVFIHRIGRVQDCSGLLIHNSISWQGISSRKIKLLLDGDLPKAWAASGDLPEAYTAIELNRRLKYSY